ncbi:hypothetical protein BXY66_0152 [Shimia isoporae]|uniref:Uncharacterized protein n=1 Tax=Shimia isoporae TaxID=647720 RepID=A0A4R1NKF5_9RHOB|nr:hypothetical protein [Shimia isoporae]TCL08119.1 hypothetical protein BXY66_0152 [Shimia isoporae]
MAVPLQSNMVMNGGVPRVVVLTPAQSVMVKAALSQYGGRETAKVEKPEPTKVSRGLDSQGEQAPGLDPDYGASKGGTTQRELGSQTLDSSVRNMINNAVTAFNGGAGGKSFAQFMMAELKANGIDSTQSFIDYYA